MLRVGEGLAHGVRVPPADHAGRRDAHQERALSVELGHQDGQGGDDVDPLVEDGALGDVREEGAAQEGGAPRHGQAAAEHERGADEAAVLLEAERLAGPVGLHPLPGGVLQERGPRMAAQDLHVLGLGDRADRHG